MTILRVFLPVLALSWAHAAQAAPPLLAHCGGCGPAHAKAKTNHQHGKTASVGHAAPTFKLKDLNGKEHSLEQYKGKTCLLYTSDAADEE